MKLFTTSLALSLLSTVTAAQAQTQSSYQQFTYWYETLMRNEGYYWMTANPATHEIAIEICNDYRAGLSQLEIIRKGTDRVTEYLLRNGITDRTTAAAAYTGVSMMNVAAVRSYCPEYAEE